MLRSSNCFFFFFFFSFRFFVVFFISDGIWYAGACDLDQAQNGCRIDNGACSCSYGCKSEFRYATRKECTDALKVIPVEQIKFHLLILYFILIGIVSVVFTTQTHFRVVPVICAAVNHVYIVVVAFKSVNRPVIDAVVRGPDIGVIDANENVQMERTINLSVISHMNALSFDQLIIELIVFFKFFSFPNKHLRNHNNNKKKWK